MQPEGGTRFGDEGFKPGDAPPPPPALVLPDALAEPFTDIRIIGVLEEHSYVIRGEVLRIYLQLSQDPPLGWSYIFKSIWHSLPYEGKPQVGVDGGALWIDSIPAEVLKMHKDHLERTIAQANATYRPSFLSKVSARAEKILLDQRALQQLGQLQRSFAPKPVTPPPRHVEQWPFRVGLGMCVFCALWCGFGLLSFGPVSNLGSQHSLLSVFIWLSIFAAGVVVAFTAFKAAFRPKPAEPPPEAPPTRPSGAREKESGDVWKPVRPWF